MSRKKREKLVVRMARSMMKKHDGPASSDKLWAMCLRQVKGLGHDRLGVIAIQDTDYRNLFNARCGEQVGQEATGREIIKEIATTALMAEVSKINSDRVEAVMRAPA